MEAFILVTVTNFLTETSNPMVRRVAINNLFIAELTASSFLVFSRFGAPPVVCVCFQNHNLNAQFKRVVAALDSLNHYANPARPSNWPTLAAGEGCALTWSPPQEFKERKWEDVLVGMKDATVRTALIRDLVLLKVGPPSCYQDIVAASDCYVQLLIDEAKKDISMVVPIYQLSSDVRRITPSERFQRYSQMAQGGMSELLRNSVGSDVSQAGGGILPTGVYSRVEL